MPQQIFIQKNNQYNVAGDALFEINLGKITQRDIPVDPNKMHKSTLVELLKHAGLTGISTLKKAQLVQLFTQWYVIV
jgi:hypothetical protein